MFKDYKSGVNTLLLIAAFCLLNHTAFTRDLQNKIPVTDPPDISVPDEKSSSGAVTPDQGFLTDQEAFYSGRSISPGMEIGTTTFDVQSIGRMNRQVGWRGNQIVHFTWTKQSDTQFGGDRGTAYQAWDPGDSAVHFTSGCDVHPRIGSGNNYSGYVGLDVDNRGMAVIGNHHDEGSGWAPTVWFDFDSAACFFSPYRSRMPDSLMEYFATAGNWHFLWPSHEYQIWDGDTITHVFALQGEGGPSESIIAYFRRSGGHTAGIWEYPPMPVDTVSTYAHTVTTSRSSGKVALVWTANLPAVPGDGESVSRNSIYINDVYYMMSDNMGTSGTWGSKVNITGNDSSQAGWHAQTDLSCLIDSEEKLHVVWDAREYSPANGGEWPHFFGSRLFHWSEHNPAEISMIKDANWDLPDSGCTGGGWNQMSLVKPQISECNGNFYAVFVQFNDIFSGVVNDCADARWTWGSYQGTANGEIYLSISNNNGRSWDIARNLTNSYTPHCDTAAGMTECDADMWPSMSRYGSQLTGGSFAGVPVVDPTGSYSGDYFLDVLYVNDKFPGSMTQDDGVWTVNPVKWFRLPCIDPAISSLLAMEPDEVAGMTWTKPGVPLDTVIHLMNVGNTALNISTIQAEELTGTGYDWLAVNDSGPLVLSHLPPTDTFDLTVSINYDGNVTDGPHDLDGYVIIDSDSPTSPDTAIIHTYIADTIVSTPAGSDVAVQLNDSVALTFDYVYQEGITALAENADGPAPPAMHTFVPPSSPVYYGFLTTAGYIGEFEICINYDDMELVPEDEAILALMQYDGSSWSDITVTRDTVNNTICGRTDTLSVFAVSIPGYICGDARGDGNINILDITYLTNYLYNGGDAPPISDAADIDSIKGITNHDAQFLADFLYYGGVEPHCPPFPDSILPITDDTLEIRNTMVPPDSDHAVVEFYLKPTDTIAGLSFPFSYACSTSALTCDSISFVGSVYDGYSIKESAIEVDKGIVGIINFSMTLNSSDGLAATVWFSLTASVDTQYIIIDTTTFDPGNRVIFSKNVGNLEAFIPTITTVPWTGDTDLDDDGVDNDVDNCPMVYNPGQENGDTDSFGDACDNCPSVANEDQTNSDTDDYGDACDNCPNMANPDQANFDTDTLGNSCDNCPYVDNNDQSNTDTDSYGDACDNCVSVDNESQTNSDSDSHGDDCDNCIAVDNEDQANSDTDSFGNVCDNCPNDDNNDQNNSDTDSFGDICDNCPSDDNEDQADGDGDNVGDLCDNCPVDYNPDQADGDSDGIGDACDSAVVGSPVHVRVYVVEPESRYIDNDSIPFYFGFLDFALDTTIIFDSAFNYMFEWDGTAAGFGDVDSTNIMMIAALFDTVGRPGFADPPDSDPFTAYYSHAAAAAAPGETGYNSITDTFTHTVFVEYGVASWCTYSPASNTAMNNIYISGDYPFYFTCLVKDFNTTANTRITNDYNSNSTPTGFFDGGYGVFIGGYTDENLYRSEILNAGTRIVPEYVLGINTTHLGGTQYQIQLNIDFTCVDADGDGFGDPGYPENDCPTDNCPQAYNPDQLDTDEDGIGDVCDTAAAVWYVKADGSGDAPTIQAAIDLASGGDTVLVAAGTYSGPGNTDIDFGGKQIWVKSESGPGETTIDCIADSLDPHRAFYFHSGEDSAAVVSGFTIINGYGPSDQTGYSAGGAIFIDGSSPRIEYCVFDSNFGQCGGAVYGNSAPSLITNCVFAGNRCEGPGNSLPYMGGGLIAFNSDMVISICEFRDNYAVDSGGAIMFWGGNVQIEFTVIESNQAYSGGAVNVAGPCQAAITHTTFYDNYSGDGCGTAIFLYQGGYALIERTILAYNQLDDVICRDDVPSDANLLCTNIFGNEGGDWTGFISPQELLDSNMSVNPYFCDTAESNFALADISGCAPGNNQCNTVIGTFDVDCVYTGGDSADVGVTSILSPPDSVMMTAEYPIAAEVTNYGPDSVTTDIIVEIYMLDGELPELSDTASLTFQTGQTADTVFFASVLNVTADTSYQAVVYTLLEGDIFPENDTLTKTIEVFQGGRISGRVYDVASVPISGAFVRTLGTEYTDVTDIQGNYNLFHLPEGVYDVEASKTGYYSHTEYGIEINPDTEAGVDIFLSPVPHDSAREHLFDSWLNFAGGTDPKTIDYSDFDGDGDIDLVTANLYSDDISIIFNTGNGTFALPVSYDADDGTVHVCVGDIDNDSDKDIIATNYHSGNISVFSNDGSGMFQLTGTYDVGINACYTWAGDLDNNGTIDLAAARQHMDAPDNVVILLNDGSGNFSNVFTTGVDGQPCSITGADLDGDGDGDLAVSSEWPHNVGIFRNNGDSTFILDDYYPVGNSPRTVTAVDLDNDLDFDLAAANTGSNELSVLVNNGDGTFAASVEYYIGEDPQFMTTGDVDYDGFQDLVSICDWRKVGIFFNNGDATFGDPVKYVVGNGPSDLVAVDMNGDSLIDLGVATDSRNVVAVLLNEGGGTYPALDMFYTNDCPYFIIPAEFNSDPYCDLAVARCNDTVSIMINNGDYTFGVINDYGVGSSVQELIAADFNGDLVNDLATVEFASNSVTVLFGVGDGSMTQDSTYEVGEGPESIFASDFDNDNDIDFATANVSSADVTVRLNNGDGTFGDSANYPAAGGSQHICGGDFNGDDYCDLAASIPNGIAVLFNNGDGTFYEAGSYYLYNFVEDMISLDLDNDGDLDLAAARSQSTVAVLKNNGDGTFTEAELYAVGAMPKAIVGRDFDGDGDYDLVTGNYYNEDISLLLNNGDGSFENAMHYGAGGQVYSVAALDIENDTDFDLAALLVDFDMISILYNLTQAGIDSDGDGVTDPVDNCPDAYNPTQADADSDDKGDACDPGEVKFGGDPLWGYTPLEVSFTDSSIPVTAITEWLWLFGDGGSDTARNPVYVYGDTGHYDVTLIISDGGNVDTAVYENYISVFEYPAVDFTVSPGEGSINLTVGFTPSANVTLDSILWDYGDGSTGLENNHIYTTIDTFTVKYYYYFQTIYDSVVKEDVVITTAPYVDLIGFHMAGQAPLDVYFMFDLYGMGDSSSPVPTEAWIDPGNGDSIDFIYEPIYDPHKYTYTEPGVYDVVLHYFYDTYEDSLVKPNMVQASSISADFDGQPRLGYNPLSVDFNNLSTGPVSGWKWYFGDGDSSSTSDPTHIYNTGAASQMLPYNISDNLSVNRYARYRGRSGGPKPAVLSTRQPLAALSRADKLNLPGTVESNLELRSPSCSTYYYHNGQPAYIWPTPDFREECALRNVRFTSEGMSRLQQIEMLIYDSENYGNCVGGGLMVYIWYNRDGFPDEVIDSVNIACEELIYYPDWLTIDVSDRDIYVSGDFHIGYGVKNPETDTVVIISDNGENHSAWTFGRSSERWTDLWWTIESSWGWDYAFLINAVLCPVDGQYYDISLIVDDGSFTDTLTRPYYIAVMDTLVVGFTASPVSGRIPLNVSFESQCNTAPASVRWYFGDGDSSHVLNPVHEYTAAGIYTVKLAAELAEYSDSLIKTDYIFATDVAADFIADQKCGSPPLDVQFTDLSSSSIPILGWSWDFGDGVTSDLQNPSHQYQEAGMYDVVLITADSIGADTLTRTGYIIVQDSVSAGFVGFPKSGKAPLNVVFEPVLDGIADVYLWEFGDGETSSLRNPIHTYTTQGKYDVKLRVQLDLDGCSHIDSLTKLDYISVSELDAQFNAEPTAGQAPLLVQFNDLSHGSPQTWYWNFGDGGSSLEQNPLHLYDTAGLYDVFLRVQEGAFTDSMLRQEYIHADTAYTDLAVDIEDVGAKPGFEMWVYYIWTNVGTVDAESCTLKVVAPPDMAVTDVLPCDTINTGTFDGYTIVDDTIYVSLGAITPSEWPGGCVKVMGILSEFVPVGDSLETEAWLSTITPENFYTNNYAYHIFEVTGSIDPNDKKCYPKGEGEEHYIDPDQRLKYMVQFENKAEATAEATYIRVVDTLSPLLDWASLAIGEMSHPRDCDCEFDPYTGVITWYCDSIMLPPNVNPPEGEGYFLYSVAPKKDLPAQTQITNTAWIRFDYNAWLMAPEDGPVVRTIAVQFMCGDVNNSFTVNLLDITYLISYLYKDGPPPEFPNAADVNSDGTINILDITYLIAFLYKEGAAPVCP